MTMHSVFLKQHDGIIPNPVGQLSSASVPWWSGLGSQTSGAEPGLSKGNTTQFTIFPVEVFHGFLCVPPLPLGVTIQVLSRSGHLKASDNGEKSSKVLATFPMQSTIPESHGRVELGYAQPLICGKYPCGDQFYGLFSSVGPQITGRIMLPLNLTTDDGPIYVNAKQYHGIIRRRISRAKAEAVNKALKVRKPYLHLSRHLHAMRRPRGCGGRFLNTKTSNCSKAETETKKTENGQISQYTDSQNSEVVQSDSGNLNSPNEVNGRKSSLLGTEVTSIFSGSNLNHFSMNQFRSPVNSLSQMTNSGHDFIMFGNWV